MTARTERALIGLLASLGLSRIPFGEALERLHEGLARAGTLTIND